MTRFVPLGRFHPPGGPARALSAFVPDGVDTARPHPTLYLFDGQNVFGDEGSFAGGWHADVAVGKLGRRTMDRPVVVGIGNGGRHRIRELGRHPEPFLSALITEVIPRVEARLGGGGPRVIGGSSLGGLAALDAWTRWPDVFDGGVLAMSPSLWFADRALLADLLGGRRAIPSTGRVYLDAGARESTRMLRDAARLAHHLHRILPDDRLRWRADPRGGHNERAWARRLPSALRFLFAKEPVS